MRSYEKKMRVSSDKKMTNTDERNTASLGLTEERQFNCDH